MHTTSELFALSRNENASAVGIPEGIINEGGYELKPGVCKSRAMYDGHVEFYYWPKGYDYEFGWKWHLAGPRDIENPTNRIVGGFLMQEGIKFKIGHGNEGDAAFCVYVGSWNKSMALAHKLESYLSDMHVALPTPISKGLSGAEISYKDMSILGNIWGRFEVPRRLEYFEDNPLGSNTMVVEGIWKRYGRTGIPDLGVPKHILGDPSDYRRQADHKDSHHSAVNTLASHAALKIVFGEFYQGSDPRVFYCHLINSLGGSFMGSGEAEIVRLEDGRLLKPILPAQYGQPFLERQLRDPKVLGAVNNILHLDLGYRIERSNSGLVCVPA